MASTGHDGSEVKEEKKQKQKEEDLRRQENYGMFVCEKCDMNGLTSECVVECDECGLSVCVEKCLAATCIAEDCEHAICNGCNDYADHYACLWHCPSDED